MSAADESFYCWVLRKCLAIVSVGVGLDMENPGKGAWCRGGARGRG